MISGPCHEVRHLLEAYVDGELPPATVLAIEDHVPHCEECRERITFQRAMRGSLRRGMRAERLPDDARARLMAALVQEVQESEPVAEAVAAEEATPRRTEAELKKSRARSFGVRSAVPLTAAAALALLWGASAQGPLGRTAASIASTGLIGDGAGRVLLEELVHEHSRPLPPERTDPKDLREFERYVGVPVKARALRHPNTRFVGGRVMPMHQERAAMLQYEVGSGADAKRVSVLVYDPRRIQVGSSDLAPRTVGSNEVRVGRARGYSVAVTQRDGVGYALASDLDTEHSAQFVNFIDD